MKNLPQKLFFAFIILLMIGCIFANLTLITISAVVLFLAFLADWHDPRNMMGV
jgi:hypothetical protein